MVFSFDLSIQPMVAGPFIKSLGFELNLRVFAATWLTQIIMSMLSNVFGILILFFFFNNHKSCLLWKLNKHVSGRRWWKKKKLRCWGRKWYPEPNSCLCLIGHSSHRGKKTMHLAFAIRKYMIKWLNIKAHSCNDIDHRQIGFVVSSLYKNSRW